MEEFDELFEIPDDWNELRLDLDRVPKRYFRDIENPFELYRAEEFKKRYRFTKECVLHIIFPIVRENLIKHNNKGLPIPTILQLLASLRFYASNSFQIIHGDLRGISQATISRIIKNVSTCLASRLGEHVKFPLNVEGQRANTAAFYEIAHFPNVSGCIDCTHIPIKNPGGENGEVFRNRKGWFSLNVQVIAGPRGEILDIVVRHPGSTHDSIIFERSAVRARLERGNVNGILLGDNGYPCRRYLLTPFIQPNNRTQERYNNAHKQTRNIVERLFGQLKRKFACLHGSLRLKLETSTTVICAVAVLYNIGLQHNQNDVIDDAIIDEVDGLEIHNNVAGLAFRTAFAEAHF